MKDRKKFATELLKWYDENYGLELFNDKDFPRIAQEFIDRSSKVSDEVLNVILNDLSGKKRREVINPQQFQAQANDKAIY